MTIYEYIKSLSINEMALFLSNFEWYLYICDADKTGDNLKKSVNYLRKYMSEKPELKLVLSHAIDIKEALESELKN